MQLQKPRSLNSTGQQRHSQRWHRHQARPHTMEEDKRPWTLMQSTKVKESTRESTKEKERTKEKATEDTATMDTTATKEKEKEESKIQLDKAIPCQEKDSSIFSSKEEGSHNYHEGKGKGKVKGKQVANTC